MSPGVEPHPHCRNDVRLGDSGGNSHAPALLAVTSGVVPQFLAGLRIQRVKRAVTVVGGVGAGNKQDAALLTPNMPSHGGERGHTRGQRRQ